MTGDSLLIYIPVPLLRRDGRPVLEEQACNGLRLWAENFAHVTVMLPSDDSPPPPNWVSLDAVGPNLGRVTLTTLPTAYRPDRFLRSLPKARRRIAAEIGRADYLSFAIGGLFGDWGAVASFEARRLGRPYAVWTDRVESEVVRQGRNQGSFRERLRSYLTYAPMARLEQAVIRRAAIGLFHGRETFEAYAPYCTAAHLVHDIHISHSDHIPAAELAAKVAGAGTGPLRICYAGRADAMKGALDWVEILRLLAARSVEFTAVWLGEGTERAEMRRRLAEAGLADRVELPGLVTRDQVRTTMRTAQVFLFCHKTPESPRCLIEALISGCPIVGYDGAFARDLIAGHGGGLLTPLNDIPALTDALAGLASDRADLARRMAAAARDGAPFDERSVFHHRGALIKSMKLPRPDGAPGEAAP